MIESPKRIHFCMLHSALALAAGNSTLRIHQTTIIHLHGDDFNCLAPLLYLRNYIASNVTRGEVRAGQVLESWRSGFDKTYERQCKRICLLSTRIELLAMSLRLHKIHVGFIKCWLAVCCVAAHQTALGWIRWDSQAQLVLTNCIVAASSWFFAITVVVATVVVVTAFAVTAMAPLLHPPGSWQSPW